MKEQPSQQDPVLVTRSAAAEILRRQANKMIQDVLKKYGEGDDAFTLYQELRDGKSFMTFIKDVEED